VSYYDINGTDKSSDFLRFTGYTNLYLRLDQDSSYVIYDVSNSSGSTTFSANSVGNEFIIDGVNNLNSLTLLTSGGTVFSGNNPIVITFGVSYPPLPSPSVTKTVTPTKTTTPSVTKTQSPSISGSPSITPTLTTTKTPTSTT
jgi:hypothetical protein